MAGTGERFPERLCALVPVSIRQPAERGSLGNRLAAVRVALPTTAGSAVHKLAAVTHATRRAKRHGQALAAAMVASAGRALPAILARGIAELTFNPRLVNLIASGIPGPKNALDLAGRALTAFYAINFAPADHGVSVTLMSYRDHVFVSFAGDAELPALAALPGHWLAALDRLQPKAGVTASA
jgi:hypothetical protein